MSGLGNVIWFVFGGFALALFWLIIAGIFAITIIGLPIARACLEFAKLSAFPFGKEVIRDTELKGVTHVHPVSKVISVILNIIWFPIGLILTIAYLVAGILSFITIIGIPVGIVYIRMGAFLLFPIGARVVSKKQAYASAAANEMEKRGFGMGGGANSQQNIVVNVNTPDADVKISAEKQILALSQKTSLLSLKDIISETSIEMDEAETVVKKLVDKGIAKEIEEEGKKKYDFS
jgi:uncharacterized membrane protein YccF (DUF307 family)